MDNSVHVRTYKPARLEGGTLVVSVPHAGIANILLTDFLLEQLHMDQVAALDSEAFPAFAMVHRGRARFPARLHADPKTRMAVLRCEFSLPPSLARPVAAAVLDWAEAQRLERVIAVDVLHAMPPADEVQVEVMPGEPNEELPGAWFSTYREATRKKALAAGLQELKDGVLDGVCAVLLLEARFRKTDVVGLFTERRDVVDDARGVHVLTHALRGLVPGLPLDMTALEERLAEIETAVRQAREQAERALRRLSPGEGATTAPPMYG